MFDSDGIWIMNSDATNLKYLGLGDSPSWSPDGERIIYYHYGISHINIDGSYDINPDSVG